mgnify:CR=1 FL=1
MGKVTRKRYSAEFKSRVALEAIRGEQTLAELTLKHGVHQTMIAQWKRQAIEGMAGTFSGKQAPEVTTRPAGTRERHQSCVDAADRWSVSGDAVLRVAADDVAFSQART